MTLSRYDAHLDDAYQDQCDVDAQIERAHAAALKQTQVAHDALLELRLEIELAVPDVELDLPEIDAAIRWLQRKGAKT